MYDGEPNQGMRCIKELVKRFEKDYEWKIYDVRSKAEVPDLSYDIYISTGGPGSPHEGDGYWDKLYYNWMESLWRLNIDHHKAKKYAFFICHSFQMACDHFKIGNVTDRKTKSFGTFPVHMTDAGAEEPLFKGLPDPFYVADFRSFQVIQPDLNRIKAMGAKILTLEKIRPHVPLERAIMSVRFSDEIIGTQFHPEADVDGMVKHFQDPERKAAVIKEFSEAKYNDMIKHLKDKDKIGLTHSTIIPLFISQSLKALKSALVFA